MTSKQRNKQSNKRKKNEEHLEGDNDDDEESDYEVGKNFENAFKKKKAKASSRVRKQTNKKGAWIDNEDNNQSLSSAPELDSDDEKRAENIEVDEDALLNLFNNYSSGEMQSMINVSDMKVEKIISNRPFADLNDLVRFYRSFLIKNRIFSGNKSLFSIKHSKLKQFGIATIIKSTEEILYARSLVNKLLEKCKILSKNIKDKVKCLTEDKANAASSSEFIQQPEILNDE